MPNVFIRPKSRFWYARWQSSGVDRIVSTRVRWSKRVLKDGTVE